MTKTFWYFCLIDLPVDDMMWPQTEEVWKRKKKMPKYLTITCSEFSPDRRAYLVPTCKKKQYLKQIFIHFKQKFKIIKSKKFFILELNICIWHSTVGQRPDPEVLQLVSIDKNNLLIQSCLKSIYGHLLSNLFSTRACWENYFTLAKLFRWKTYRYKLI